MSGVDGFRRLTVGQVARRLELHPFVVVRLLAAEGAFPRDLQLDETHVEAVRRRGKLETWWEGRPAEVAGESFARTLGKALVRQLLDRGVIEPSATRDDNLFRGLDSDAQMLLRRAVNLLIKDQFLTTRMAAEGLMVAVHPAAVRQLREFVGGDSRALDALWDRL